MSARRYADTLPKVGPRWWRQGDRTIAQIEREQRLEAQRRYTDDPQRLADAMQRRLGGER